MAQTITIACRFFYLSSISHHLVYILSRLVELADAHKNTIKLEQQQRQSLETDVRTLTNVVEQQQKMLDNLQLERDRTVSNTQASANKADATQSQLAIKTREIMDLTWELNEATTKLKHTQQNLETVMGERAALQRTVDVITDDRNDARERLRVRIWWDFSAIVTHHIYIESKFVFCL